MYRLWNVYEQGKRMRRISLTKQREDRKVENGEQKIYNEKTKEKHKKIKTRSEKPQMKNVKGNG